MIDIITNIKQNVQEKLMIYEHISDDSSYQDEESSESNKSEFKIKQDRKHQLGGRTVSSLSVPTAGSQDNCASVSIPVPSLKPGRQNHQKLTGKLSVPLPRDL